MSGMSRLQLLALLGLCGALQPHALPQLTARPSQVHRSRQSPRMVLDSVPITMIADDFSEAATYSFVNGVSGRVLGAIAGNILAGAAFAALSNAWRTSSAAGQRGGQRLEPSGPSFFERLSKLGPAEFASLAAALAVDGIGDASYILPGLGDMSDVAWAPASALIVRSLYGSNTIAGLDFVKEALPFTDVLPVATLAWIFRNLYPDSKLAAALGLAGPAQGRGAGSLADDRRD